MRNVRGWGGAGMIATMSLTIAATALGVPGCHPGPVVKTGPGSDTTGGTVTTPPTGPASPLNFTALDSSPKTCVYTYDTGSSSTPTFTLKFGGKGITVSADYPSSTSFEQPPGSMEITYGDPAAPDFDSNLLTLSPSPGTGITVTQSPTVNPTSWSMTAVGSGPDLKLSWGKKWTITFSCGARPACCANTQWVHVVADGTF